VSDVKKTCVGSLFLGEESQFSKPFAVAAIQPAANLNRSSHEP
jgi:hypothetical protein